MKKIVILPYFSNEEVKRYLKILDFYERNNFDIFDAHFICANRRFIEPSKELVRKIEKHTTVEQFVSKSEIIAYPDGPTIFFWEIMTFVSDKFGQSLGFVFWHESDMLLIKENSFAKLESEWNRYKPVVLGLYDGGSYLWQQNVFSKPHINGGACYSTSLAKIVCKEARKGFFDIQMYEYLNLNNIRKSDKFCYAAKKNLYSLFNNRKVCVLHGISVDKDDFVDSAIDFSEYNSEERKYFHKTQTNKKCCQYYYSFFCVGFCPAHVNNKIEKFCATILGLVLFFYVKIKSIFLNKKTNS